MHCFHKIGKQYFAMTVEISFNIKNISSLLFARVIKFLSILIELTCISTTYSIYAYYILIIIYTYWKLNKNLVCIYIN